MDELIVSLTPIEVKALLMACPAASVEEAMDLVLASALDKRSRVRRRARRGQLLVLSRASKTLSGGENE